jgi:hypothetical protein
MAAVSRGARLRLDYKNAWLRRSRVCRPTALNAAISGSILAKPEACFVTRWHFGEMLPVQPLAFWWRMIKSRGNLPLFKPEVGMGHFRRSTLS